MRMTLLVSCLLAGAGCKADDLLADLPDAAVEPDAIELPDGDWSCLDEDWPVSPAGDLQVTGAVTDSSGVGIGGATVEIFDYDDGTLLATTTSSNLPATRGRYAATITVDGTPTRLLRKSSAFGRLDGYQLDPAPISARFLEGQGPLNSQTAEQTDDFYGSVLGDPTLRDETKGDIYVDLRDCSGAFLAGVTVAADGAVAVAYTDENGQVGAGTGQTETSAEFGTVSLFGLEPGTADVTMQIGAFDLGVYTVPVYANATVGATWFP